MGETTGVFRQILTVNAYSARRPEVRRQNQSRRDSMKLAGYPWRSSENKALFAK
jgi:hypothetical protein